VVSTYQAVSGAGASGVKELQDQMGRLSAGGGLSKTPGIFPAPIAANVIPEIGGFDANGYTSEEMKLVRETRKILGDSSILVTPVVAARVPVVTGHSEAVLVETERPLSREEAMELFRHAPGIELIDNLESTNALKRYPMPMFAQGKDTTYVGRVRQDLDNPNGLTFWVVSDNLRKGAATNAVQIAEHLVTHNWLKGCR
jgi:aspartate-semialdehyde dehydrogenase